jgi:hypothetical protein
MFDGSRLYSDDPAGPTTNMDFCDNIVEFVNDDCIEADGAGSNCRIYNNTFTKFLTGVSVAPAAGGPTYIFRNVLSGWETHSGYVGYPVKFNVNSSMTIDWVYLYHNTCYTSVAGQPGFLFKQYSAWNNIISRNNIYAGTGNALESWSTQNPVDFDYDALYTTAPGKLVNWASVNYATVAAFSAAAGQESHAIAGDPQFINAGAGDFHLQAAGPLVDKGVAIPGINDGFQGAGPDIGCFESGSNGVMCKTAPAGPKGLFMEAYSDKATGRVFVRSSRAGATIKIYSLKGELVYGGKMSNREISIRAGSVGFIPGVYVVLGTFGRSVFRTEFAVMR